jgi:hypothetical protein
MSTLEPEYINSAALATMLSVSKKFIEKHRHAIVGSRKIGGCWRFSVQEIRARLVTGRDIITTAKSTKV